MADRPNDASLGSSPDSSKGRTRAPTITIDTSAVRRSTDNGRPVDEDMKDTREAGHYNGGSGLRPVGNGQTAPPDLQGKQSFESRDSRPTSPHNVSSPQQWNQPGGFLSVPSGRSRGNSIDTEETSSTSDVTYVNTHSASDGSKAFGSQTKHEDEHPVISDEEALKPDPGTEDDFHRENNPFAFTPGHMSKLLNPKSLGAFHALGGLVGLEKGLRTDRKSGLSVDEDHLQGSVSFEDATHVGSPSSDKTAVEEPEMATGPADAGSGAFDDRKRIFDENVLPEKRVKNIFELMWIAYNDKVLIVLTVAAVIALSLGIYQAIAYGGVEWIEGVAIIVAIAVVVLVGAINDWQKERQFAKLNKKKEARNVKVVRSGKTQEIDVQAILVGDVLLVEPGDILPVDGIFITGHGVKCDESSATGESDIMKKTGADEVFRAMEASEPLKKLDPFMISGGKITEGVGRMIVTAIGTNSTYGKTMLSLQESNDATPLQAKLNKLAEYIAKLGSSAALLLFVILLIKFLAQLPNNDATPAAKGQQFMTILITAVTIVVVAVPEGLPLAVTLSLAYATKRMLKDNNLVRVLRSCETMGNATTVCSDKTGTLTQNVMTVVAGTVGTSSRFSNRAGANADDAKPDPNEDLHDDVDDVTTSEFIKSLSEPMKLLWKDSIAINSTAFEAEQEGKQVFVGSKTETALLDFARDYLGMDRIATERSNAEIVQMIPFDSGRKYMAMVIKRREANGFRLIVKGASEIMLRHCHSIIRDPTRGIEATSMTAENKKTLEALIDAYASRSLRTIGFIYRDFDTEAWPPRNVRRSEDDKSQAMIEDICKQMTFLGLVGIQDPLRAGVPDAVKDCIMAGVFPRMVTGDNILTAKAIATECGIFTPGGLALEGPEFRKMSKLEQRSVIPKLQVLARSSPDDKKTLVKRLKEMGETVAVTGDGTNDAPALKAADVGFAMNIAGTEVAKEASDIILMDDNFASIVKALMWGRAVNDAVRKFLQFQITVNITAVLLAFISAVSNENEESVLTAVQLLWINLIMDTMAALALATDPPSRQILNRKPDPKSAPLFSVTMWKMIIGQAIYQLTVTLILYFAGASILGYDNDLEHRQHQTLVFNTFTWMQIFNALNNRRLDNRFNVFEGLTRNLFFVGIFMVMIGGQVLIIFVGGWDAFNAERQTGTQWGIALVLGALSLPIGVIVRLFPDEIAAQLVPPFIKKWSRKRQEKKLMVTDEEGGQNPFEFNQALYEIKEELAWLKKYKGGRINSLKFAVTHPKETFMHSRSPSRSRASSSLPRTPNNEPDDRQEAHSPAPPTPESRRRRGRSRSNSAFAGAAMAGIVAGSIAGGWSPVDRREGDADSLRFGRDRSKSDLSKEYRLDPHPETSKKDDVVVKEAPVDSQHPPSQRNDTTPAFPQGPYSGEPSSAKKDDTAP
ncbi:Putative P-type ATPase, HAD superfamily, P-type ATPase, transmembrane domain superfamily [Septoria linicola]|uniref:Calcium-transporting ATPase n=1 Tax=Septoria linicola TaxID=215465 RepID=A0A9Q9AJV0_9PEZI|nr:putative P-type ATPase, HAD superfamily, P-type ATPase, transmembrane domain superfamily [Septoria linicola]USW47412.1 Putative P-type ATPase, HAD superfamily, P-type ATPase, transmembrane domain superfamily [Septoria linicola]